MIAHIYIGFAESQILNFGPGIRFNLYICTCVCKFSVATLSSKEKGTFGDELSV